MINPSLKIEKKLWEKGFKNVVCLDEAGRGAICGPVVAAAVIINSKFKTQNSKLKIKSLRDSKKLSPKRRQEFYNLITKNPDIDWGIGQVSEKVIDKINILEATKLAMKKAIKNLKKKVDFLILDGNFKLDLPIPQKSIIKADQKVFSCAVASIIAKVTRDKIMMRYHLKYPQYQLAKHKGYLTRAHLKLLKKYGPTEIYRKSFQPVKACQKK
jgi:ribonuclease HII